MTDDRTTAPPPSSLGTEAARNLATTTKTPPQMQGITPRWLLRLLPWVEVQGGTYRVNRLRSYATGDGRPSFEVEGGRVTLVPASLAELPWLRGLEHDGVLAALAARFVRHDVAAGGALVEAGAVADHLLVLAHGRARKVGPGPHGAESTLAHLVDGDHLGDSDWPGGTNEWPFTVRALTDCVVLSVPLAAFDEVATQYPALAAHFGKLRRNAAQPQDIYGQAAIKLTAGHRGETPLRRTFVDYQLAPREYDLSVAQTVLRVHTRVADLYSQPMNQREQQLRLTMEALRERQEHELINNREFGLLHNADLKQRVPARGGPPTPDDLDEILCRRRGSRFFLAHPRAIAAFGRECNRRGLYAQTTEVEGARVVTWRNVPIFPCNKLPISANATSSILVMRTGADDDGVVGLHRTGLKDEHQPGISVRFSGIDEKAVSSYLVSAYYSAAVLVPDALGILEDVDIGRD